MIETWVTSCGIQYKSAVYCHTKIMHKTFSVPLYRERFIQQLHVISSGLEVADRDQQIATYNYSLANTENGTYQRVRMWLYTGSLG